MQFRDDRFKELGREFAKKTRALVTGKTRQATARRTPGASYFEILWFGRGKYWRKLTKLSLSDLEVADGTDDGFQFHKGVTYYFEVRFFIRSEDDVVGGNGWQEVGNNIGYNWDQLVVGDFFGVARLTAPNAESSKWVLLQENPSFPNAKKAAKRVASAIPRRTTLFSAVAMFAIFAGFLAGAWFGLNNIGVDLDDTIEIAPSVSEADVPVATPDPDLLAELEASQGAMAAAKARIGELEQALTDETSASESMRRELEALRVDLDTAEPTAVTGSGLSLAPCWVNTGGSFEAGTHADYIYDVHLSDAGIKVSKTFGPDRDDDYAALPVAAARLDKPVDRYTFAAQFVPLFDASVADNCRHFVRVYEGQHASADLYKAQRDAVEGFFYIYRPHRTRY